MARSNATPQDALPCPPLTIRIDLPREPVDDPDLRALPPRAGVYALEDERGRTIQLSTTANLRRAVRARLRARDDAPKRRADVRTIARHVAALDVGGSFEADWAYLQLARRLLPDDADRRERWRAWFVHCDPEAAIPQLSRTSRPPTRPGDGIVLGPFPDGNAARRFVEMLEDAFDLCRYHHILVQAPDGDACAYKEMGRCPAPCDGSVSMSSYREQVRAAIAFVTAPAGQWRRERRERMRRASAAREYEIAQRLKRLLDLTAPTESPPFDAVDRLDRFRLVAVCPSQRRGMARLFTIVGGWIEPAMDVDAASFAPEQIVAAIADRLERGRAELSPAAVENVGMVCRHLFGPGRSARDAVFMPLSRIECQRPALVASIRRAGGIDDAAR